MTDKIVAFIPARGGSKRLPRKNILPFMGKPIIAHTIEAALAANMFEQLVVSSEDEEITRIGADAGASIHDRSPALATDTVTVAQVCCDFLETERQQGREYDILCVLYATAPLRTANDIRAVVDLVRLGDCDKALATTFYSLPPHQALKMNETGQLDPMWPDLVKLNTRELPQLCVDNGSTYAVRIPQFLQTHSFYGTGMRGHLMPTSRSVDIDTPDDFEIALHYAKRNMN